MKKFSKIVSVVAASAMVLTMLTGCGGNGNPTSGESGTVSSDNGTVSSDNNSTADSGSTAGGEGVFKIGGIGPLTGGAAIYGIHVMNAAQIAVDEINAAGGANGYMLELNFQDDEHDAEKAVNAYNTLKDWGAQILMGTVTSSPCVAVAEKTKDDNMFQITPSASSLDSVKYDNIFRVCFADPNQGVEAAKYMADRNLGTKVAVIYDSSDTYSTGIYEAFVTAAANYDFEIVSVEAFTADNKTDFSVQLQKAKDAQADLLFLPIYYNEAALILAQAATMDYAPVIFSCDGMDGILGVENFDTSLAEGVMFLSPFATDANQTSSNFTAAFESKHGETPNQFAADGYDAIYIIKTAIEKSGATPDMSVSDLCEAIKGAMVEIQFNGTTGTGVTWTADGEPNKIPIGVRIENGAYTFM